MKRIAFAIALAAFASGCVVHHAHPRERQRYVVVKDARCHPSQYWDGKTCKHKGKGHGARKHDGRR